MSKYEMGLILLPLFPLSSNDQTNVAKSNGVWTIPFSGFLSTFLSLRSLQASYYCNHFHFTMDCMDSCSKSYTVKANTPSCPFFIFSLFLDMSFLLSLECTIIWKKTQMEFYWIVQRDYQIFNYTGLSGPLPSARWIRVLKTYSMHASVVYLVINPFPKT